MADKDEEYHFSETETRSPYTTGPNGPGKDQDFQSRKKSRNVILFIAGLMACWSIYKFIGLFLSQPPKKPTPAVALTPQTQPIRTIKPQTMQATLSNAQIQDIGNQKTRLNKLESDMVNLQTTLSDMSAKLNDVSTEISSLNTKINKPPPIPVIKKPFRPKKRPPSKSYSSRVHYSYSLEAVIPGRAWLMRSDGDTLTVSLGDKIPGYGTVTGIDSNEGVVQISSGATIKYRSH